MKIQILHALQDNFIFLVECKNSIAVFDPSEAGPVLKATSKLDFIFNTHHHWDHVGGNLELKKKFNSQVIASEHDRDRIPGFDLGLLQGEYHFGDFHFQIIPVPGHTLGAVAYWFPQENCVFTGDTLFSVGCGRLFEGSADQMWESLCRLRNLPAQTKVYFGHEYTQRNIEFALGLDPYNQTLLKKQREVAQLGGTPTVPSRLAEELACNPFLRADDPALSARLGLSTSSPNQVFAEIRRRKDSF